MTESTKYYLYVLQPLKIYNDTWCKINFYVLHHSRFCYDQREFAIMEAQLLYDYVDFNNVEIKQYFDDFAFFDIDPNVKSFMVQYGIENVRGGSYQEQYLPEYKKKSLEEELKTTKQICDKHSIIESIIVEHCDLLRHSNDNKCEIQRKYDALCETIEKYEKIKKLYEYTCNIAYTMNIGEITKDIYKINRELITNIEFLETVQCNIREGGENMLIKSENYILFHKTIAILKQVYVLFTDVYYNYYNNHYEISAQTILYMKNPEFLFNNTDYHNSLFPTVIDHFKFMVYFLINRNEEFEFEKTEYCENQPDKLYLQKSLYEHILHH